MIRVFLADDHTIVRDGLRRVLADTPGLEVVGDTGTGTETLRRAHEERWDVVLLDLSLPDRSGLDVLKNLKLIRPKLKVLILTMHAEDQYAVRVLKAGADGYLTKGRSVDEVVNAIHTVVEGGKFVSPQLAQFLLTTREDKAPHESLSDREHDILLMLGQGHPPSAVAAELGISPSTVSTHIHRIKMKLNLDSVGKLIQYAVKAGLVE